MVETTGSSSEALHLIESIEELLKRLRGLLQPKAADAASFDPRDPRNKDADGK